MSRRFSFDQNDDQYPPPASQQARQYYDHPTARGSRGYSVSSTQSYLPGPIRSPSPPSPRPHPSHPQTPTGAVVQDPFLSTEQNRSSIPSIHQEQRRSNPFTDSQSVPLRGSWNSANNSPYRENQSEMPPPPPPHRDPHSNPYVIPPPQMQSRNLEAPSDYRNPNDIPQNATAYSAHGYPDYPAMSTNRANVSHGQPQGPAGATPGLAGAAAVGAGAIAMTDRPGSGRPPNDRLSSYGYGPYGNNSGDLGSIDPHGIADDDDEPFHIPNSRSRQAGSAAAASAGAGGATGFFKGLTSRDASGNYKEVAGGGSAGEPAKSGWLKTQVGGNRRFKLIVGGIIGAVVVLAIIGGSLGAYFGTRDKSTDPNSEEVEKGSDLTKDSDAIKALMGRDDLHKVFPGIDYTPFNSQYPECMHNMPTQNNITMDIAVLSQLTTQVRLYGTDCKQADMVMRAITALELQDSLKMWLGVWLDGNKTTNARQMDQMWDFLDNDKTDGKALAGVIIGNEVLFRKEITLKKLSETLQDVRKKLTQKGYKNIPVTTSDLGSNWTPELAKAVDVVMANVHPFFGGISAKKAASWTWDFWQNNDVAQSKKAGKPKQPNLISEVGWPSSGGSDCGSVAGSDKPVKCKKPGDGAIASIDGINTFMDDWVCESLKNGTQYFWFEAFDEPWKVKFNEKGAEWEDKWGFMTGKRELKDGVKIPDCDGKTATLPEAFKGSD